MANTKGIPSIPDVPAQLSLEDIQRILDPLARTISIRQGRFDPLDRWVTQQDLIDAGLQTAQAAGSPIPIVPSTSQFDLELTGDIEGGPTTLATGFPLIQMPTIINLPNVVCIDGGDAAETFPASPNGPYGVAGAGAGSGVPDGGTQGQILIKQSAADGDAIWDDFGPQIATGGEYCPGYSSYTRVDNDTFTIDLIDAENLFYVGRRVKFDKNGALTYGVVSSVDYNISNTNDTTVNLTMEGADTVPTNPFDVCLVSSATAWSPIAGDPFGGSAINDITTGVIGATQWWFAVGNNGKVATSSDGGATWTLQATVTTQQLYCCAYDSANETFWGGGEAGVLVSTTNGTTITEDTTSIPALATTGTGRIHGIEYSEDDSAIVLMYEHTTFPFFQTASSVNQGSSWVTNNASLGVIGSTKALKATWSSAVARSIVYYSTLSGNTTSRTLTSHDGSPWNAGDALGAGNIPLSLGFFWDEGLATAVRVYGTGDGQIIGFAGWTGDDTNTFTQAVNDFAWSPLHDRLVSVGNSGQIGYLDSANQANTDAWTSVPNGFAPTANINAVAWNEANGVYVAVANNGQICRSTNGTN